MTIDEYQTEAMRTASGMDYKKYKKTDATDGLLINGLMGLNGEAGECIDILKKHLFQGHELDKAHLAEELGDVLWYIAVSARAIDYDLSDIVKMNVVKLINRYPDGFSAERSINRYYRYCVECGKKADVTDRIDPMVLAGYLENNGWSRFHTKRTDIRIYQKECGKFFQVIIPMNNTLADYNDALREACKKAAECEGITTEQLCSRLLR